MHFTTLTLSLALSTLLTLASTQGTTSIAPTPTPPTATLAPIPVQGNASQPLLFPVTQNYNVASVQAAAPLSDEEQGSNNLRDWCHVRVHTPEGVEDPNGTPYRGVILGQLTILAGTPFNVTPISVQTINHAGGSGKYPAGSAIECRAFLDEFGQIPYGAAFGDAPGGGKQPYLISGSNTTGVELRTVFCINKGVAIQGSTVS